MEPKRHSFCGIFGQLTAADIENGRRIDDSGQKKEKMDGK